MKKPLTGRRKQEASSEPEIDWEPMPRALSDYTGFVLHWTAELSRQMFEAALAPLGLRPFQIGILHLILSEGPMVQARLSDLLLIDKATMVGILNEMEGRGLIERRPHPTDRRAFEIHPTDTGRACLAEAQATLADAKESFFEPLDPEERQMLHELLRRLATSNAKAWTRRHAEDKEEDNAAAADEANG
jgi:Transcriptional regulators